jgi:peroxiredoxin
LQTLIQKIDTSKVAIVAISTIGSKKATENFLTSALMGNAASFPVLMNGAKIQRAFKGRGTPNTFIIDQQGKVRYRHRGFSEGMKKYIELEINSLLNVV